ncbi:Hypothetical predicted protein [Mytilus galloprovincialis]|uniref:Uncharacterized protein n=1 Tax=Mytilus galloprovincialis TaxID=29158 RepID=A0A8B6BUY6_MYTGA|nr:Hypothetical predicted protein [Mytilus galloprovincialis]
MKLSSILERYFDILFKCKIILLIINSYQWTTVSSTLQIPSVLPVISEEFVKLTITTSLGARYKRSNPPNSSIGEGNQSKNVTSRPPVNSVGVPNNTGSPNSGMHNGQGTPTELNMTVNSVGASNNTGSPSPGMHNGQGTPTGRNTKLNSSGASNNTGSPTSGMHNGQGTHIQNLHGTPTNNMKAASNNPPGSGSPVVPTSSGASSVPRGRIGSYLLPNELRVSFTLGNDTIHLDLLKNRQFGRHAVPVFTKFSDGSIVQHGLSAVKVRNIINKRDY